MMWSLKGLPQTPFEAQNRTAVQAPWKVASTFAAIRTLKARQTQTRLRLGEEDGASRHGIAYASFPDSVALDMYRALAAESLLP